MQITSDPLIIALLLIIIIAIYLAINRKTNEHFYYYQDPLLDKIKKDLIEVDQRAAFLKFEGADQSYTEDKARTFLCLKDEDGNYYDYNMLMYVALHELAHAISKQVDVEHKTDEFKENFKFLLKRAEAKGLYDPKKPLNYNYCPKNNPLIKKHNS